MPTSIQGPITLVGRIMLAMIFFMSAAGNKIPKFNDVAEYMQSAGVPMPKVMLFGAIVFLLVGSLSLIAGLAARVGATLLLIFLVLATYYFHGFWRLEGQEHQMQMIQFMKNTALMGAMLMVIANGAGPWSFDNRRRAPQTEA